MVKAPASASKGKKGGKAPSQQVKLTINEEWVVEHACQVSRMLPGGLAVVGLYVFAPEDRYKPQPTR